MRDSSRGTGFLKRVGGVIRAISGMPDYEAYVTHLRRCHPERSIPSERDFYDEYVKSRYGDGPTRCC
jgi:uncharacterized short protein YbdD (DUF466 family)